MYYTLNCKSSDRVIAALFNLFFSLFEPDFYVSRFDSINFLVDRVFPWFVLLTDQTLSAVVVALRAVIDLLAMRDMAGLAGEHAVVTVVGVSCQEVG